MDNRVAGELVHTRTKTLFPCRSLNDYTCKKKALTQSELLKQEAKKGTKETLCYFKNDRILKHILSFRVSNSSKLYLYNRVDKIGATFLLPYLG